MAPEQASAEKELLKIIENPGAVSKKPGVSGKAGLTVKKGAAGKKKEAGVSKALDLKALIKDRKFYIKVLGIVLFWVFIFFVVTFIREYLKLQNMKKIGQIATSAQKQEKEAEHLVGENNPTGADLSPQAKVSSPDEVDRNIFRPGPSKKKEEPEKVDPVKAAFQDFKLVGTSLSVKSSESYAMVENIKSKTTQFLKEGDALSGAKLIRITEDKAVFQIGGRQVELR